MMTEHQKQNRINYLNEYIDGWVAHYNRRAPKKIYEELENLEKNLPVKVEKDQMVEELTSQIIDQWNDNCDMNYRQEAVEETAFWFFENLKTKTINNIQNLV